MGVLITALTLVLAWVLALLGVTPLGAQPGDDFAETAMRWMLSLPAGPMILVSGVMHTFFAKKTAAMIGWQTNGFQYEIGFASYGMGLAGLWATGQGPQAWVALSIVLSVFLLGAAANHIKEMIKDGNFHPGNSVILVYDIGLPLSMWGLLIFGGMLPTA